MAVKFVSSLNHIYGSKLDIYGSKLDNNNLTF